MASGIRKSYHKQLFVLLIACLWTIILCFIGFQYVREKQYKTHFVNAQLQLYNSHLVGAIDDGEDYRECIGSHAQPFEELRISVITLSGKVVYDNMLPPDSLDNHSQRPEVAEAMKKGVGYHIGRLSASDGREYFYSATRGDRAIVRTAIPYTATLRDLLEADWTFLGVMVSISLVISILAYFITRRIGASIERINEMEAEQEKTRLKRQLTNNINHELKTPVASIGVCLETLLSGINLSEEKRQELIERCYANNERLRRLLSDVSLITRMEDGNALIEREPVDITALIADIASELTIMPEGERLTLHTDITEPIIVEGNLSLIASIFRNLTENAIAYSEGKNIYVSLLESTPAEYRIRFEDDGRGVEEKQLTRLFERFYRVDKGRSRQKGGTGLGLSIVKHAVQFHGGTITATNRPGGGLRFDFSLRKQTAR